ncbi:hypothetical protein [Laribacter hongkongensis]|nr:hypothetical protein [Laribacter hongkongensis]
MTRRTTLTTDQRTRLREMAAANGLSLQQAYKLLRAGTLAV